MQSSQLFSDPSAALSAVAAAAAACRTASLIVKVYQALHATYIQANSAVQSMLQPEALPLFRQGQVDAWVVWVPYTATQARSAYPGRSIADLESILGDKASLEVPTYYYAIPELVRDYPDLLKVILEEVNEAGAWAKKRELEAARRLAENHEIDPSIVEILQQRSAERAIIPIDDQSLTALQHQANTFRDLNLIPERVNVKDGTYSLQTKQNWTY